MRMISKFGVQDMQETPIFVDVLVGSLIYPCPIPYVPENWTFMLVKDFI